MVKPDISVIIPVYNVDAQYMTECMESVLIQKGADFEVIMVDDGSTNGSSEWCDDWAKKDSRIRVIHKKNGGVSSARNAGIKESNGEYLVFIDPDDWWEPDLIEKTYEIISKNSYDLLFFGFYEEYPKRQKLWPCGKNTSEHYQADESLKRNIWLGVIDSTVRKLPAIFGACWNLIVKRSLVIDNEIFFQQDIYHGEDSVFVLSLLEIADRVGILDSALHHYRYNLTSVCKKLIPQLEKNHEKVLTSFYQILSAWHDDPDFRNSYAYSASYKYCVVLMQDYFHKDNKEKACDKKRRWKKLSSDSVFANILKNADYKMLFRKSPMACIAAYFTFKHRSFFIVTILSVLARTMLNVRAKI